MGQAQLIGHVGKAQRIVHDASLMGNEGAPAPANLQHIPGNQQLHGLPHGAAAYVELFGQLKLIGQFFPVGELTVNDELTDLLSCLLRQRLSRFFTVSKMESDMMPSHPLTPMSWTGHSVGHPTCAV